MIPVQSNPAMQYSTYLAKGVSSATSVHVDAYEHMLVVAEEADAAWRARTINSQEMPDWEAGPDVSQYLAAWGADGWEAVGLSIANQQMYLLLKRAATGAPRSLPR